MIWAEQSHNCYKFTEQSEDTMSLVTKLLSFIHKLIWVILFCSVIIALIHPLFCLYCFSTSLLVNQSHQYGKLGFWMLKMCLGATQEQCYSTSHSAVLAGEWALQRHRSGLLSLSLQQVISMLPVEHEGLVCSFCREASAKLFLKCVSLSLKCKRAVRLLYFSHINSNFFLKKDGCVLTLLFFTLIRKTLSVLLVVPCT